MKLRGVACIILAQVGPPFGRPRGRVWTQINVCRLSPLGTSVRRMTPIYDAAGRVCAWLLDDTLRSLGGRVVAFVRGEHIYSVSGRHLGAWDDGNIRDHRG